MKSWFTSRIRRLWRWISERPKRFTIPVSVIIVVVLAFGTYLMVDFWDYMDNDPDFCNSCHIMETSWDKWASSEHSEVGCHSCHHQSMFASASLLINFIFGDFERIEEHSAVPDEVCKECHENEGNSEWRQVAATAGHKKHTEEENIACVKCHSVSLHRFQPPGPICSICHDDKHVETEGMAAMHCTACHAFLTEEEGLLPHRSGCLECHEALSDNGITWPADAPMQYDCGECHLPHEKESPIASCSGCHTVDGMHLGTVHKAIPCDTCHKPHAWVVTEPVTCLTCHPDKVDHNKGIFCGTCHVFNEK